MIDEIQIRMPVALLLGEQKELLLKKEVAHILSLAVESISYVEILKLSLDTRSVRPFYQLSLKIYTLPDTYSFPTYEIQIPKLEHKAKVLICGCGPAGLFAALTLAKEGLCPVIIERGKTIKERKKDIALLCREGYLNPNSNYCFGEGGAGCFSDGKLYTRSNKRGDVHQVLETLVGFGADPEILYQAHPHLGSDKLPGIMERIRLALIHSGAEFHFETCVEEILVSNGKCTGVRDTKGNDFLGEALILACGHSARNIYEWLDKNNYKIEAKAFALGVRLEHPQALINAIQYHGGKNTIDLPPAQYSFAEQVNERGVFSFCMCPGGMIIPSSTEADGLVLNGMSDSGRNSPWANSAMVVTVNGSDYGKESVLSPLAGLDFQRSIERQFFNLQGKFQAPAQRMTDFVKGTESSDFPKCSYPLGIFSAPIHQILPSFIAKSLQLGFKKMGEKRKGFFTEEAVVVGLESRSSSPVKIGRKEDTWEHPQIEALYPCGEGSGYAGGITSSAIDGVNSAKKLIAKLRSE